MENLENSVHLEGNRLEDFVLMAAVATLLLTSLSVINFALINYNTRYPWMPYVAGPLVGGIYLLSLAIPLLNKSYTLYMVALLVFVIPVLISYVLTYQRSSIYGFENVTLLLVIDMALAMFLHRIEGADHPRAAVSYSIGIALVAFTFLLSTLLSFRYGTVYDAAIQSLLTLLSFSLFLSLFSSFTLKRAHALTALAINWLIVVLVAMGANFLYPDATLWMLLSSAFGTSLIPSYLVFVYGIGE